MAFRSAVVLVAPSVQAGVATCTSGTATAGDVLAGITFSSSAGLGATGTMPNNGAASITPGAMSQVIPAGYHNGAGTVAGDPDLVAGSIKSGVDLFGVIGNAPSGGQLLKTAQVTCWNASGAVIPCPGTGQDGEFQKGLSISYTDNGDGTITDNNTGLMWEKLSDDGSIHDRDTTYTWTTAVTEKIATLNSGGGFAGHTDWRLPNVRELASIVNYANFNTSVSPAFNTGCLGSCTVLTCSCTRSGVYWSSSSYVGTPYIAWGVFFNGGDVVAYTKTFNEYVRAVRGGA